MVTPTRRNGQLPPTTKAYIAGTLAGGGVVGLCLYASSLLVPLLSPAQRGSALVCCVVYGLLVDVAPLRLPHPGARRQVPEQITSYGRIGSFYFGLAMGTGVRTYMTGAAPWVVAAVAVLSGQSAIILLGAGVAFGGARGSVHLMKWMSEDPLWQSRLIGLSDRPVFKSLSAAVSVGAAAYGGWHFV